MSVKGDINKTNLFESETFYMEEGYGFLQKVLTKLFDNSGDIIIITDIISKIKETIVSCIKNIKIVSSYNEILDKYYVYNVFYKNKVIRLQLLSTDAETKKFTRGFNSESICIIIEDTHIKTETDITSIKDVFLPLSSILEKHYILFYQKMIYVYGDKYALMTPEQKEKSRNENNDLICVSVCELNEFLQFIKECGFLNNISSGVENINLYE